MKKCTKCKEEKSLELFNRNRKNKDGLSYICKECNKAYCDMNQDKIASYRQKYKEARSYIKNEKLLKKEAIKLKVVPLIVASVMLSAMNLYIWIVFKL